VITVNSVYEILIEVDILSSDNFLVIKETLDRIGVKAVSSKTLYPSCMIIFSKGKYYIGHFKAGFVMIGKPSTISYSDLDRCYSIAKLLEQWGLVSIIDVPFTHKPLSMNGIFIVPFKEKREWTIEQKFTLGKRDKNAIVTKTNEGATNTVT